MPMPVQLRALIFFSGVALLCLTAPAVAADAGKKLVNRVTAVTWQQKPDTFLVTVTGAAPLTYTAYELNNPLRIVLDIADASLDKAAGLPMKLSQGPATEVTGRMIADQEPFITRVELILAEDRVYAVERAANSIVVKFASPSIKANGDKKKPTAAAASPRSVKNHDQPAAVLIKDVSVTTEAGKTRVLLKAAGPIQGHRHAQLPKGSGLPDRLYIDIPDVRMTDNAKQIQVGTALARIRMAHRGSGLRVVFDSGLDRLFRYEIDTTPQGLLITIMDSAPAAVAGPNDGMPGSRPALVPPPSSDKEKITPKINAAAKQPPKAMDKKPGESPQPVAPAVNVSTKPAPAVTDMLSFAGYNNQKITVDFFKIDLHNVFRLIGEISGSNIVVDEGVNGSLTLALTEVPWDFVLDVVLNLKNLQKEERYNTIVISPKSKEFNWPKRATDQLAVKADGTLSQQDAITIKKKMETPPGIIEATKLVHQGNEKYRNGDYPAALPLYEDAFAKWPENKELAERITAMALVHLGMNAKAVHYAKAALALDPGSSETALHAAIGLANMKRTEEAKKYFDMAISGDRPSSEALLSYAAFCEENDSYQAALNLLLRHEQVHGNSMESIIAKARVYDKMGRAEEATREYREVLLSGFNIPADLKRYINGRIELTSR
jgi:type IV pilus assembly protein PilQ